MTKGEILAKLQKIREDITPDLECWENELCPCCVLSDVILQLEMEVNGSS